jgi:ATP-dependent DNA ligase
MDGNNERIIIHKGYIKIWGSRPNKDGMFMEHTNHVPHIINIENIPEELDGTTLHGELFHESGSSFTSGLLNSIADKAWNTQQEHGKMKLYIFDITSYKGKDIRDLPYSERRKIYSKVVRNLNDYIEPVKSYTTKEIKAAFDNEQEGLVIKNPDAAFDEDKWLKIKHSVTTDCKVIGFFEPTKGSKYDNNAIGGFIVKNGDQEVRIGIGLSDTLRRDAFQNPDRYLDATAMIESMEITDSNSLRSPRFVGWHPEKSPELAIISYAIGSGSENPESTIYAMKSAAGWRKS